jgi:hypothetical protein
MGDGAVLGYLTHPAAHLQIAIGVVGIEDRQRDRRTLLHVAVLDPAARRIDPDRAAGIVEPHRRHLRRAVRHQRRQIGKGFLVAEQIGVFGEIGGHQRLLRKTYRPYVAMPRVA